MWLIPAVVLLAVTLPKLGQGAFRTDTGWYSAIALQAWRTGELWTLMGPAGEFYFKKPPLGFWAHGLALHSFGVSLEVARLPSVLAALGCVLLTVGVVREMCSKNAALASGCVLALTYEFFRRVREVSLDMWQLLFMLAAVWIVVRAVKGGRGWWRVALAGVPIGLALMCKPLVGLLVIPMLGVWLVWVGETKRLGWLVGTLGVALLVAGPWHVSMWSMHGDAFVGEYFGAEIAARAKGDMPDGVQAVEAWWYYLWEMWQTYWPWLVVLALALVTLLRGKGLGGDGRAWKLAFVWSVGWLVALSLFSDKRPRYALPVYPGFAWLCGMWLARWPWAWLRPMLRTGVQWAIPAGVVAAVVFALLPVRVQREDDPQWDELAAWIEREGVTELWAGSFLGIRKARVYLAHGWWPRHPEGGRPGDGDLVVYHLDDGMRPGAGRLLCLSRGMYASRGLSSGGRRL